MTRRTHDGPRPLSFPQERLFLLDQIMPGLPAYNVPTLVRLRSTLDADLLRRAFEAVVQRHEILRTSIRLIDGAPVQETQRNRPFDLQVIDLRSCSQPERDSQAQQLLAALARRPFDLSGDTLLRAALVHMAPDEDQLLIVFHHVGSDHASSALLFAELDSIYTALASGVQPDLPALPVQYSDFAQWQRERLAGEQDELIEYWRDRLAGAPERLDLPTDRPRPSVQSYRGALREFSVRQPLVAQLRTLAREHSVSLFMVLLAGFNTLLHRYTGAEDLVVGVPVSGRQHEEIASLLGFFSNTLALRSDLSGDPTFAELLSRVKATTLEAQIYQELPFEKLVEVLNPERTQSYSPLFQVLLGFDVAPAKPPALGGSAVQQLPVPGWEWSRFDLSIVLREVPDGSLQATVEYATDLFDEVTIGRLVGQLQTLLAGAAADPRARLSELPILTEDERHRVLAEWNASSRAYDCRCLHELFSEQAMRTPDAIAVSSGAARITYAELERQSNQLARDLQGHGVRPRAIVGICVERSIELVTALLGVLKTGAAYVPIEPTYPPQRQEFMLADAGAQVLVTQERFLGAIDPRGASVIAIDADRARARISAHSGDPVQAESDPEQIAYVIYTSGSTGRPKGVEITHRSVANLIAQMRDRPGIDEQDVLANLTTPAFDLSVPDWYLPLTTGARIVVIPREATLDGVELADWLARTAATFVQATPTTWQLLVDAGWKGSPTLKIVCGGEALPRALADQLLARGASLWHMYGPTETTVWSSIMKLGPGEGPVPLGGPIANTSFYVLDNNRHPAPIGVPGELYIGGDGVALGYRDRPELTAEKFVDDPLGDATRLYRTGDLVRWRESGTLEFHGRIDQQVKLRGFRIELGEIEAVLDSHPGISASVAIVREDTPGDQRLVAYVACGADPPDVENLRRLLATKLPPFMVPSTFVMLDAFPVTANGKLNRAALPAPDGARPTLAHSYTAPQTPVQETLASVWREVLGVDRVGIDDDFFDLGGHSLLAVRMLAGVQAELGIDFYLGRVFEHPTIRQLAGALSAELLDEAQDDELAALLAEVEASEP